MRGNKVLVFFYISFFNLLFGWGAGHNLITEIIIEKLPEEIKIIFSENIKETMIKEWSYYPDYFSLDKLENEKKDIISEESLTILKKYGIKTRNDFHQEKGRAINFLLLTKSFQNKNEKEIGFWIACLGHTISDYGALNHGLFFYYINYGIKPLKINMGNGIGFDIANISYLGGKQIMLKLLEDYKPKIISENPNETIMEMWIRCLKAFYFMLENEKRIIKSYKIDREEKEIEDAKLAMAELGVISIKDILDIIKTSFFYAKKNIEIQFDEKLLEEYKKKENEYGDTKPLEKEPIYEGLLKTEEDYPAIGVIVEPFQLSVERSYFPFNSKYITSSIMWYFKEKNIPYKLLDVREIVNKKLKITHEKFPVIVLHGGKLSENLSAFLKDYLDSGGTLLLIAGIKDRYEWSTWKEIFGESFNWFKIMSSDIWPVSPKWQDENTENVNKLTFYFLNDLKKFFEDKGHKIIRNPNSKGIWYKPICVIYMDKENSLLKPLIKMSNDEKEIIIGGIINYEKRKIIFIPEYFLYPFIFSEENFLKDPTRPYLDIIGRKIVDFLLFIK